MFWHPFHWGFGFIGGGFLMIMFWALIIGLVVWLIAGIGRRGHYMHRMHYQGYTSDAREIARERYAKGEISKEQYEQLKKDLS